MGVRPTIPLGCVYALHVVMGREQSEKLGPLRHLQVDGGEPGKEEALECSQESQGILESWLVSAHRLEEGFLF